MCFCCGSRVGTICAGIFCLIEAVVWLILSVLGLMAYNCNIKLSGTVTDIIYYIYFYNEKCAHPPENWTYTTPQYFSSTIPTVEWPDVVEASERTQRWVLAYIILSTLWVVTSMVMTVGACSNCKGPLSLTSYLPWLVTTLAVIVADIVSSVIYGNDISKTLTFAGLMDFIHIRDPTGRLEQELGDMGEEIPWSAVPSIVMFSVFSRGIILWVVNVVIFLVVLVATVKVAQKKAHASGSARKDSTESASAWGWSIRRSTKRSERGGRGKSTSGAVGDVRGRMAEGEDESNTFHRMISNGDSSEVRSSLRENGIPPTELRSQLPWSYFSHRDEPPRQPKPTALTKEPMPPVPPPDYTLRFPQVARTSITGAILQNQVSRSNSNNSRPSLERSDSQTHHPHGWDLPGATPVFPSVQRAENPPHRIPPKVPQKPNVMRVPIDGGRSNWVVTRNGPEVPQRRIPPPDYEGGSRHIIPEPDYSKPAMVPSIPSPDYSSPVSPGGQSGANWGQKPLHLVPHIITKVPSFQGRNTESGYY